MKTNKQNQTKIIKRKKKKGGGVKVGWLRVSW